MFTMNDLLDIAVKMEENGKTIYSQAMDKTQTRELKALLQWMAEEEASHAKWFSEQKETLDPALGDSEMMLPEVLQEMMGEKSLSLDEVAFSTITHSARMLEVFMEFEKDTILFYEFLQAFIEDKQTLAGLQKIIQEETTHVTKIEEMVQALETPPIRP